MSKSKSSSSRRRLVRAGLAAGAASAVVTALTAAPALAVAGTLSLSTTGGPTGGGNTVVATLATIPTSPNPTMFTTSTAVYFVVATTATSNPTCPSGYPSTPASNVTAVTNPAVKLLAPNKIAVQVPTGVVTASSGAIYKYAMCAFQSTTAAAPLIASAQYTVGAKPTISAIGGIAPVSGPALGSTTITVNGTGFVGNTTTAPNNTTASVDGEPLTNIVVSGSTSFSATTPAHAAGGPFLLSVTTPGGTTNTLGSGTSKAQLFNYTNGIVVSPNTAPQNNGSVDMDVLGVGFANYTFDTSNGNTPNTSSAHVYLTGGSAVYNPLDAGSTVKTTGETTECINVLVVSDTELLCSMPLNHTYANATGLITTGAAARTTLNITTTSGSAAITSNNAAFTQADVGMPISDTAGVTVIPAGATITAVASPTSATMSTAAIGTSGTLATGSVGGPRTLTSVTTPTTTTLVGATGTFTTADVGRLVTSATLPSSATPPAPGIPDNTTIISVNATGTTATLSAPLTGTIATSTPYTDVTVTQSTPVPNGTYTVTVVNNGAVGAQLVAGYQQSIVSSGSTFTVADY